MSELQLLFQQPWIAQLGWTLLHFLWQGTLIALIFAVVRALAGPSLTARARYALACLAFGIMMVTPVITFITAQTLDGPALTALWPKSAIGGWQQSLPRLVAIWLAGVIAFTVRLIGGWRLTTRLRSTGTGPVPDQWQESLDRLIRRMKVSTPVRLLTSSLVAVPTVAGWLRPVILMPIGALAGLPLDQVEALLAHELAHIRRQDYVVNILQSIAEVVLFYHPAVWWVSEQIRAEREACCDDLAVEASGDVLVYVRALTDLEANRRAELRLKTALAADGGSLVNRIRRLVQPPQPASHNLAGPGAAWALSVLWLAAIGAATLHAAPAHSIRTFAPTQHVAAVRLNPGAPVQFPAPPEIRVAAAPLLTALMFDPFFDPPQAPAQPATDTSQQALQQAKISVSGTVVTTAHELVKKAGVRLQMIGGPSGQMPFAYSESTDDAGKFTIENVAPGTYSLTASKMGFVGGAYGARAPGLPGATITLDSGATLSKLEVTLTPQGIVTGKVTNQDGDPVTRVQVAMYRSTYSRGRKVIQLDPALRGQTNDLGAFTVANVTPGRYYLRINSGEQPADIKPGMGDVTTFYPGSLDLTGAVQISVAAGARVEGMDVRLRRERVYSAAGRITMNGSVVKNLVLELSQPNSSGSVSDGTPRLAGAMDGTFVMRGLFPGTYRLTVSRRVANPQQGPGHTGHLDFTITDSDLKDLELSLSPGVEVTGSFKLDGGKWSDLFPSGQNNNSSGATPPTFYPSVGLVDPDIGFFQNPMRVSAEGTFKLRTVPADRYLLDITGLPQGTYVKSIRYGTQDVTRSPVDFVVGGGTLDITLSKNAATISGILRNDKGETLSGVQVTVWPKNPNLGLGTGGVRSIYTDQNGAFKAGNLEPGDYFAAAWEEIDSGLAQAPEFLGRFTSKAAAVTVSESSQVNADVKMVPKDAIAKEALALQ